MHAWCGRTAVIVMALLVMPWTTAAAADKAASASGRTTAASTAAGSDAKININTASAKELMSLTGIGPKVAERIVAYRDANGPFKKAEDLKKVEGIGKGLLERNRERIVTK
jgi:competence protein ComEA